MKPTDHSNCLPQEHLNLSFQLRGLYDTIEEMLDPLPNLHLLGNPPEDLGFEDGSSSTVSTEPLEDLANLDDLGGL